MSADLRVLSKKGKRSPFLRRKYLLIPLYFLFFEIFFWHGYAEIRNYYVISGIAWALTGYFCFALFARTMIKAIKEEIA